MKKLNIAGRELKLVGPKRFKDTPGTQYETNEVINFLKKDKEAVEYINKARDMETGEDFMFAFENYLKEEWKGSPLKWNRVNWDRVRDYFFS